MSGLGVGGRRLAGLAGLDELTGTRYEKRGRVAYVTLNRPDCLNAMDLRMHEELALIWDDFETDDELWLAVLTGAGDRAFSAGQDLKELAERIRSGAAAPATFGSRGKPGWPRLTERFTLTKPVIARVNGHAFGGGFELALACDVIVAADHATFALPEAKLGLIAGAGGVFRLTRQAPYRIALGHRSHLSNHPTGAGLPDPIHVGGAPHAQRRRRGGPACLRREESAALEGMLTSSTSMDEDVTDPASRTRCLCSVFCVLCSVFRASPCAGTRRRGSRTGRW
ncbi:hypothetical protein GCM10009839_52430 [Catenulispora yoronensis]|uniref:Enoyl-CoA hydratase n=1 Tax=Catenulispora yoronensis TaxID=450799 RepID=A0ABP5GAB1_9ACTN